MKQVIAFIAPVKFVVRLGDKAKCIGFRTYTEQGVPRLLNGSNDVFYVYGPGDYESGCFDQKKADKAVYILVPDVHADFDRYDPKGEFAVLYHNETEANRVAKWTQNEKFFCGNKKQCEEPGTIYEQIADQITGRSNWDFDEIWTDLTLEYFTQSVDQFTRAIKQADRVDATMLPPILSNFASQFDLFISEVNGKFELDNSSHEIALGNFQETLFT